MASAFDENEIENLLNELETAVDPAAAAERANQRNASQDAAATDATAELSSRQRPVAFTTYVTPLSVGVSTHNGASPPSSRLPVGRKLAPIGKGQVSKLSVGDITVSSALPPAAKPIRVDEENIIAAVRKAKGDIDSPTDGRGGLNHRDSPSRLSHGSGDAISPDAGSHFNVNFLPVMHARAVEGVKGIIPKPRWGHTLTAIGDALYLFGGTTTDGDTTNDLFAYYPADASWEPQHLHGSEAEPTSAGGQADTFFAPPVARTQHSAVTYNGKLVIFGGSSDHNTTFYKDIFTFDTNTQRWACLTEESYRHEPNPKYGHTAVVYDNRMYTFGGKCQKAQKSDGTASTTLTNDVNIFCFLTNSWKKRIHSSDPSKKSIISVGEGREQSTDRTADDATPPPQGDGENGTEGAPPSAAAAALTPAKRFNHAACLLDGIMYIHGGETTGGSFLSDLWALDISARTWRQLHDGTLSVPRAKHSLFACGEAILVLGGVPPTVKVTKDVPVAVMPVKVRDPETGACTMIDQPEGWIPVTMGNALTAVPASRRGFSAAYDCGFIFTFGGVTGSEQPNNILTRCLATDGIPLATVGGSTTTSMGHVERLLADTSLADIILEHSGEKIPSHRIILQTRCPKFLADILSCRCENNNEYNLEGNNRAKGLSVALSPLMLRSLLRYVYCGEVPVVEDLSEADVHALVDATTKYDLPLLGQYVTAPEVSHRFGTAGTSPTRNRIPPRALIKRMIRANCVQSYETLLDGGAGATATVLFVDPHTQTQSTHAIHPLIMAAASKTFRKLLVPLLTTDKTSVSHDGIVAKKAASATSSGGGGSRRGLVVGPVPIPDPAVKYVLRYLYTGELDILPEVALPTMLAAHTLRLPLLQAHCESMVAREEVSFDTACAYLTLAAGHGAPLLEELCSLTAALGFKDVQHMSNFKLLPTPLQARIQGIAADLEGKWVPGSGQQQFEPGAVVQKDANAYTSRMNHRLM